MVSHEELDAHCDDPFEDLRGAFNEGNGAVHFGDPIVWFPWFGNNGDDVGLKGQWDIIMPERGRDPFFFLFVRGWRLKADTVAPGGHAQKVMYRNEKRKLKKRERRKEKGQCPKGTILGEWPLKASAWSHYTW